MEISSGNYLINYVLTIITYLPTYLIWKFPAKNISYLFLFSVQLVAHPIYKWVPMHFDVLDPNYVARRRKDAYMVEGKIQIKICT